MQPKTLLIILYSLGLGALFAASATAQDIEGIQEHPLISRYPGQEIRWQVNENYMPYRVAVGPVTGYRQIGEWIDTQGRVTRTFYRYQGTDRSYAEIYKNYLDALTEEGFEILAQGMSADRRGAGVGSRQWTEVLFKENPASKPGEVGTMFSGTSSSGGAGAIVARKERVVLDGIFFDFNQATIKSESATALAAIAEYLQANGDRQFYIVGHTDSVGTFAYNQKLSADRARAVASALVSDYGIAAARLEPHGVGPLVPVFSNEGEAGREQNRRVELVEKQAEQ